MHLVGIEIGLVEPIENHQTRAVTLIAVAEEDISRFEVDGQTKLIVDNDRLIRK